MQCRLQTAALPRPCPCPQRHHVLARRLARVAGPPPRLQGPGRVEAAAAGGAAGGAGARRGDGGPCLKCHLFLFVRACIDRTALRVPVSPVHIPFVHLPCRFVLRGGTSPLPTGNRLPAVCALRPATKASLLFLLSAVSLLPTWAFHCTPLASTESAAGGRRRRSNRRRVPNADRLGGSESRLFGAPVQQFVPAVLRRPLVLAAAAACLQRRNRVSHLGAGTCGEQ